MNSLIIKILYCHCLGDFVFQSNWMAEEKSKSRIVLLAHSILYSVPFSCFLNPSEFQIVLIVVSHYIIDWMKIHYKKIITFERDQLLHIIIAFGIFTDVLPLWKES